MSQDTNEELLDPTGEDSNELTDDEVLRAVRHEVENAITNLNMEAIKTARKFFDGELPVEEACEDAGEFSDVVSEDVRNAVISVMGSIMPGFYGDNPVVFTPNGAGDEQHAESESKIIHHVMMTANKGYHILQRAFQDALVFKNCFAKVYWDTSESIVGRRIRNVPVENAAVMDGVVGYEQNDDGTLTIDLQNRVARNCPMVEWAPREQVLINTDHEDVCLDDARFVCHLRQVMASDLIAFGVPRETVDQLDDTTHDVTDVSLGNAKDIGYEAGHKSSRKVTLAESYYHIDADGDGIAELRRIITAGGHRGTNILIEDEPWDDQPFVNGVALFGLRGFEGISLEERIRDLQTYKSELMRQILDAGWRNLNQRIGVVERMVNVDDLLATRRRGGVVRMKDVNGVFPLQEVQIPHQSFLMLEVLDKMRRESGAGSIDAAPQAQQVGADSAHGLERIMSAMEQDDALIAKNLAETFVSQIYLKLHRLMKRHWPGVINARVQGTWLEQVPQMWSDRHSTEVAVGLSSGTRMRQAASLMQVIQHQETAMQGGLDGVMVNAATMYKARVSFARLMGVAAPEQYWVDPQSPEGQQAAQQKMQAAEQAQQQQMQAQQQQTQAMMALQQMQEETKRFTAQLKEQSDQYKADLDHLQKTIDQRLKLIELNAEFDKEEVPDNVSVSQKQKQSGAD
jgi:hypothetical protein